MARPSQCPLELRRRAVRMVAEVRPGYDTEWAAMKAVAVRLRVSGSRRFSRVAAWPREFRC
ncbi:hypothetical protein GCM10010129_57270 [Streptomyces fumigatiscleroticus]|nr:hypothetical protein GCM10010129_57270 [Streptomyces fumigatiscleroticus]